ncbi:helix-turn-helix transcriptional regulator [Streptomyces tuirus]|uniref:Helix-turn-helix transcriptional regulator n=1 Tax=Streptomyces tuirus TaxID=68278 RepID=A0A941J2V5_9ACTN|nr:helix-turn-helix transcriptional regulator [Streptomyces tuirus]
MERLRAKDAASWARLCRDAFVPLRTDADPGFTATADVVRLADIQVTSMSTGPTLVERARPLIRSQPRDDVLFTLVTRGSMTVEEDSQADSLPSGGAVVCCADRRYVLRSRTAKTITVRVPRRRLQVREDELQALHARSLSRRRSEIDQFRQFLLGVLRFGEPAPLNEIALAQATAALLGTIVGSQDHAATSLRDDESLFGRVCRFLEDHATDGGLSLDAVARKHGASRRKIEMVFAAHGTSPAAYRRRLRLLRARALLEENAGPGRLSVGALAHDVGFGDATTFIRAFRREFGVTPGAWRAGRTAVRSGPRQD